MKETDSQHLSTGATARLVGWQSLAVVIAQIAQSVLVLVTAWLVDPSQFALWAIASVVFNIQSLVANLGLGPALIYRARDGDVGDYVDSAIILSIAISCLLFLATFALAPALSGFFSTSFDKSEVVNVVRAMSMVVLLVGPTQIAQSLLERRLRFSTKARAEILSTIVGVVVTVGFLLTGAGVWGLVWGRVAGAAALLVTCWAVTRDRPRMPPRPSRRALSELLRYGVPVSLAAVGTFIAMNADTLLMGRVFGAADLGRYALAFTIANLVPGFLILSAGKVAFPLYVGAAGDRRVLSHAFGLMSAWAAGVMGIVTVALAVVGPEVVPAVLGSQWQQTGTFIAILSVYGLASVGTAIVLTLQLSVGRPKEAVRAQLVWLGGAALVLTITLGFGPWAIPAAFTTGLVLAFVYVSWRARGLIARGSLDGIVPPAKASVLGGAAAVFTEFLPGTLGTWPSQLTVLLLVFGVTLIGASGPMRARLSWRLRTKPADTPSS